MKLTGEMVGLLVQEALVLEPLADKPGCTSRYVDLPGRPLENFVLSGLAVGSTFERFAEDRMSNGEASLFSSFVSALRASNRYNLGKYVNFGLLEILFPTVAARLICDEPANIAPVIINLMKQAPKSDVQKLVAARELAWRTSEKREAKLADLTDTVRDAPNPYTFYERMTAGTPHGSAAEWVANYQQGLPLLVDQFNSLQSSEGPLLDRIARAYKDVQEKNPNVRIGILADMSAAAIFLSLSFLEA